jgi:hypothetical protein
MVDRIKQLLKKLVCLLLLPGCCMFEILAHRSAFKATVSAYTTQFFDYLLKFLSIYVGNS